MDEATGGASARACGRFGLLVATAVVTAALLVGCGSSRRGRPSRSDGGGTPSMDASALDAGAVEDGGGAPVDSGPDVDAGGGSFDAGAGPVDAGRRDSGTGSSDAGPRDAGAPPVDGGTVETTISDIQRGLVSEGARVVVRDVVVTGLWAAGIYAQEPGTGDTRYAGIRIFQDAVPEARVDDLVEVEGVILEYYGETEIAYATVTVRGVTTPIAPTALTVRQALAEEYEGVLVRLTDVDDYDPTYDCSIDSASCVDSNLWRAWSATDSVVVYGGLFQDDGFYWSDAIGTTALSGIMLYRHGTRRIAPRDLDDLQ